MTMRNVRRQVLQSDTATGASMMPRPAMRPMTVMAQDPSVRVNGKDGPILMSILSIPAEDLIAGPIGYRVQVVDYDSTTRRFHGAHELPHRLEAEPHAWREGHPRIVEDFRFHAQNVYALVMKTLTRFEFALGRRVGWSFGTHQLKVAPHGMLDANAFYSPHMEALVLGYFPGRSGTVYTCLSHDVVVHETTHALIDALRERYLDPSSPDQAAFHEGLSDVIALLSVFSQPEVIQQLLSPAGKPAGASPALIPRKDVSAGALRESALFGLAEQMGEEIQGVRGNALRHSATLPPDPKLLAEPEFQEPHRRGEILVAAVMRGFVDAWAARIAGSGVPGQRDYPVARVAEEGADIATALATMWIRALDYMPPVHLEFPDALSAALTADIEVRPDDSRYSLRKYIFDAFRAYGIRPASTRGEAAGLWERGPGELYYDRVRFESMRTDKDEVFRFLWENRDALALRSGAYTEVLSVRPCVRTGQDGFTLHETVAEYYQVARLTPEELRRKGIVAPKEYLEALRKEQQTARRRRTRALDSPERNEGTDRVYASPGADDEIGATTPLYGGGVLIFNEYGRLKYHVHNDVFGKTRQAKRLKYLWETGQLEARYDRARLRVGRLSTIHRMRALDARRFPAQGW
jgi:hypothetical protein